MSSRPDLAALLVAQKVATAREIEQLERARGEQPLWAAIIEARLIDARKLFELLRDHSKVPVAPEQLFQALPSHETLVRLLTKQDALRRGLLPFELSADGRRVQVGMVDPTDAGTLRDLARSAGFAGAKLYLVERSALDAAIERAYGARAAGRATVEPAAKVGQRSELEASERHEQVLVQAALGLAAALEHELGHGAPLRPSASEAGRLAREVARELGQDRRRVALAGLASLLVQLDTTRRGRRADDEAGLVEQVAGEIGWAGGGDEGLLAIARALTAQPAGFGRPQGGSVLQRIVQVVGDFLALGGPDGEAVDLDAAGQLLRTSSAGPQVVGALMQVLRRDLAERTPATATPLPETDDPTRVTQVRAGPTRRLESGPHSNKLDHEDRTQIVALPGVTPPGDPPRNG